MDNDSDQKHVDLKGVVNGPGEIFGIWNARKLGMSWKHIFYLFAGMLAIFVVLLFVLSKESEKNFKDLEQKFQAQDISVEEKQKQIQADIDLQIKENLKQSGISQ